MSVTAVKTALAAQLAACPGLSAGQVFAVAPQNVTVFPAVLIFTGPASVAVYAANHVQEARAYAVRLYVAPIGKGITGELETTANAWFATLRDFLLARPTLPAAGKVLRVQYQGDSGLIIQPMAGQECLCIEFRLSVTEDAAFSFAAGF